MTTTSPELILSNGRIVLADRVIEAGWVAIANGAIVEIGEGRPPERGEDLEGDLLLPAWSSCTPITRSALRSAAEGLLGSGRRGGFL